MSTPENSAWPKPAPANSETSTEPSLVIADPDPNNPPWGLLPAILICISSVALIIIAQGIAVLIYVATQLRGVPVSQEILVNDKTVILVMVVSVLPAHLLTLLLAWAVSSRFGRFSAFRTLGLSWPRGFGVWKSVGSAIALFILAMGLLYVWGGADTELERILKSSRPAALMMAFLATVTAPAMEEVVYRGLLYSALHRWAGAVLAVVLVTLIFAGLHVWQYWPNAGAISAICMLSLALTMIRARTGRLLPCYVIHLVFNGIQAIIIVADPYIRSIIQRPEPPANPALVQSLLRIL